MIYLASDHRGYELKEKVKKWLKNWQYEFEDLGNDRLDAEDDYPDFAIKVAKKISKGEKGNKEDMGILICGSGVGMDIVANRLDGVRCGLGFSPQQIRIAKRDDDLNCLSLAADFVSEDEAKRIIEMFLETKFAGGEKYGRRIKKLRR